MEIKGKTNRLRSIEQNMPTKIISKLEKAFVHELVELVCKTDTLPISGKLLFFFFSVPNFLITYPGTKYLLELTVLLLLIVLPGCYFQPAF